MSEELREEILEEEMKAEAAEAEEAEAEAKEEETEGDEPTKTPPVTEAPKKSEEDEAMEIKYMRLMADFQNFRRRTDAEKTDTIRYANENIVKELLDVVDNFERALESDTQDENFKKGTEMIFKQLMAVLERAGVTEIDCLGKEFDPNLANAVMTEDSTEYDSGCVSKILQKGYKLHDRVVRPAMVATAN